MKSEFGCRNAIEVVKKNGLWCILSEFTKLPAETTFPNIWRAGGRGEPETHTLEAERKLSSLEKKKDVKVGVWDIYASCKLIRLACEVTREEGKRTGEGNESTWNGQRMN